MIIIDPKAFIDRKFQLKNLGKDEWICKGVCHPYYVIGQCWDQASNRTRIRTFKFDDIEFVGDTTK